MLADFIPGDFSFNLPPSHWQVDCIPLLIYQSLASHSDSSDCSPVDSVFFQYQLFGFPTLSVDAED